MKTEDKCSSNQIYYRIFGYSVTIATHVVNTYVMLSRFQGTEGDNNMQQFWSLQTRFLTCWTFVFQTVHAALGLSIDVLTLQQENGLKEYRYLKQMKFCRDVLFASIVLPFTFLIPTAFWPIFLYDRELVLPLFTTKIVDTISNHIMHTLILPFTLWEMVNQPRETPENNKLNLVCLSVVTGAYLFVLPYTYYELGYYPYPMLTALHGTLSYFLLLTFITAFLPIFYYLQWPITRLVVKRKIKTE